jgi:hypothetical protein
MKRKYTIYLWEKDEDGAFVELVFPKAILDTAGGEYVIHDETAADVHFGFPMSSVRYIREEPCQTA